MRSTLRLPTLVTVLILVAGVVSAQTGKIGGKVADQQGGVLPGATVVVRNVETGLSLTQVTNAAGVYNFPSLDPGTSPNMDGAVLTVDFASGGAASDVLTLEPGTITLSGNQVVHGGSTAHTELPQDLTVTNAADTTCE